MTPYGRMCSAEVNNDRWALSCTEGEQVPPLTSLTVGRGEPLYSIEASGFATDSNGLRSAATAHRKATSAAASIRSEPSRYPANRLQREPVSIRAPNNQGPTTPPAPVPIA